MKQTTPNNSALLLRLPEELKAALQKQAFANGRRITAEINTRLRESLKPTPGPTNLPPSYTTPHASTTQAANEAGHQDATRPVTEPRQYSEFGLALAGLYDDLPNNSRLRAALWGKVSALLLEPTRPQGSPQAGVPAPAATPKKPHA